MYYFIKFIDELAEIINYEFLVHSKKVTSLSCSFMHFTQVLRSVTHNLTHLSEDPDAK